MASTKRHLSVSPAFIMAILGLCTAASAVPFAGGDGSLGNPFQIATAEQLLAVGSNPQLLTQCFVLNNDIDFESYYGPEGHLTRAVIAWYEQGPAFEGWLDGRGHVIRHLRIGAASGDYCGLVGRMGPKGTILSLGLEDCTVTAGVSEVGLLAGSSSGTILGCWVEGRIQGRFNVGLLVGIQEAGTIAYGSSEGVIQGEQRVGGLIGRVVEGEILACSSDCRLQTAMIPVHSCGGLVGELGQGTVKDSFARVVLVAPQSSAMGGLVGSNRMGTIQACLSLGTVVGRSGVAGLVGTNDGMVRSCYSLCQVQAAHSAGGLVCNNSGTVLLCYAAGSVQAALAGGLIEQGHGAFLSYWDVDKSGVHTSAGGFGRTTAQMQQAATFRGWGYEGEWILPHGGTPRLWWEPCWGDELSDEPAQFSGGSGTPGDPYQIQTPAELASLAWDASLLDKHYVLARDVNLAEVDPDGLLPIGTRGLAFCGSFDGRGHTVTDLACDLSVNYAGLFGCVGTSRDDPNRAGWVGNLILQEARVGGRDVVGALTACLDGGRIERCFVTGRVQGAGMVGGAIGEVARGEVVESAFEGDVNGQRDTGGLVGTHHGVIRSCYSAGQVVGEMFSVGGLVGTLGQYSSDTSWPRIAFCYSQAQVQGNGIVGGLIGSARRGEVFACYATGKVRGYTATTGGLVGGASAMVSWRNFWDRQTTGVNSSAFGYSHSTWAMMAPQTYAGWGYGQQWTLKAGSDYPRLAWEGRAGPLLVNPARTYGGGSGTRSDPYLISSGEHLVTLSRHPQDFGGYFRLARDIDLTSLQAYLSPIGTLTAPFTGWFDGNHHTLKNLKYADNKAAYLGVFGSIRRSADADGALSGLVSNLHLEGASVTAAEYAGPLAAHNEGEILFCTVSESTVTADLGAGGLVGHNGADGALLACESGASVVLGGVVTQEGHFQHAGGLTAVNEGQLMLCSSSGQVRGSKDAAPSVKPRRISENVGGLVGTNQGGTITGCTSTSSVAGFRAVGGLVARNESGWLYRCGAAVDVDATNDAGGLVALSTGGTIAACFARGKVAASNVGGFIYYSQNDDIESCYFQGSLSGSGMGGFAGRAHGDGRIRDCYCVAAVAGASKAGAFVRYLDWDVQLANCFWDKTIFSEDRNIQTGSEGQKAAIKALDTPSFQTGVPLREAGWDFTGTWVQCTSDYPRLWWEEGECSE